ncbi:MAG: 16S rRNA (cytosine(1402)-N(4))-methyltransferase RsmH [Bacteroidales bacterium]|jgi:16S rRNA (cytosine1402-N4)-methyltransferase|nr:16S rRNA (cytosine(1402)-N(4))-methyltransferase RsmH [Bacteroidales bacterium]
MYHKPVLLQESVDGLNINPSGVYIDVTFGGGGHSAEILKRLSKKGKLFAFDQDTDAHNNTINDERFKLIHGNFRFIKNYLDYYQIENVDGILADLGVSSYQFDIMDRGFSFRLGGKLDMRMNSSQEITAADILNTYEDEKLYYIFKNYSDINNPGKLVHLILQYRPISKFDDIETFIELITPIAPKQKQIKYFAQVFQALRIEVNDEMNALLDFLNSVPEILKTGGRLSVISYHSLEDRPVKNLIKFGKTNPVEEINLFGNTKSIFKAINKQIITPSEDEILENSRAKSAKLRIAERI